jgi:hypothetical protein
MPWRDYARKPALRAASADPMRLTSCLALLVAASALVSCADPQVQAYHQHPQSFLQELVYCQNNYAAVGNTPACRAAFRVNSQLFPQ